VNTIAAVAAAAAVAVAVAVVAAAAADLNVRYFDKERLPLCSKHCM
jgi:hypothetical protein